MVKLVLVRHGQSEWNLENRFTGWKDVSLSENGIKEAREAGKKLSENGYKFDIAYTSVLRRANVTLYNILGELNQNPTIKYSWRLNERHYGGLQGLNKAETAKKYGDEQVHIWRRSADVRPPLFEDDDPRYLEQIETYKKYKTVPPKGEHLLDCLARVTPEFNIIKKDLKAGKETIVVAHGNSLRTIVMKLEKLNKDEIMAVEIPTGKPLVYELDENLHILNKYYL